LGVIAGFYGRDASDAVGNKLSKVAEFSVDGICYESLLISQAVVTINNFIKFFRETGMALMVRGSALYFGNAVEAERASLPNFYRWIKEVGSEAQWPFMPREGEVQIKRRVFCDLNATHFYGVFLSARNAEFQHFIRREGDRVIVEARSTGGNPPVEMNFFAIRLDSNKGLFSHYQGSYRFTNFLNDLWTSYRHFVEMKMAEELAEAGEGHAEEVRRRYSLRGKASHSPLFTPGTFENLIERLGTMSEVRMTTYEVDGPADQPVANSLRSVHKVYRLEEMQVDAGVRRWLNSARNLTARMLASGKVVHSGSVLGEDAQGREMSVNFENTLEDYLECEYDDIGTFDVSNLVTHEIIAEMITKMSQGRLFRPAGNR